MNKVIISGNLTKDIHRADLLHELSAGDRSATVIVTATAPTAARLHNGEVLAVSAGHRVLDGSALARLTGQTAASATAQGEASAAVGVGGQSPPSQGAAVGRAVAVRYAATAAEAVGLLIVTIHHVRLLSTRQEPPAVLKPPSPPRGRSSSVNRVPRSRAVSGSYRARKL